MAQSEPCTPDLRFAGERGGILQPERGTQFDLRTGCCPSSFIPSENSCIRRKGKRGRRLKALIDDADLRRNRGLRQGTLRGHEALLVGSIFAMGTLLQRHITKLCADDPALELCGSFTILTNFTITVIHVIVEIPRSRGTKGRNLRAKCWRKYYPGLSERYNA